MHVNPVDCSSTNVQNLCTDFGFDTKLETLWLPTSTTSAKIAKIIASCQHLRKLEICDYPTWAFGSNEWRTYFGEVDEAPPLPIGIEQILAGDCLYWPEKKIKETHVLFYLPSKVNGKPLTLDYLNELMQSPKGGGYSTKYENYGRGVKRQYGSSGLKPHWVLLTKDVIPGSRGFSYSKQCQLIQSGCQPPHILEATVGMVTHYVRTGECMYGTNSRTLTRTLQKVGDYQIAVGGSSSDGFSIYCGENGGWENSFNRGLASVRLFEAFGNWNPDQERVHNRPALDGLLTSDELNDICRDSFHRYTSSGPCWAPYFG